MNELEKKEGAFTSFSPPVGQSGYNPGFRNTRTPSGSDSRVARPFCPPHRQQEINGNPERPPINPFWKEFASLSKGSR
jgi:hypothetical protein